MAKVRITATRVTTETKVLEVEVEDNFRSQVESGEVTPWSLAFWAEQTAQSDKTVPWTRPFNASRISATCEWLSSSEEPA